MKMRLIGSTIAIYFAFMAATSNAQLPQQGDYITNTTMTPFHGIWQWANGTDTVKIYLMTKKVYYPINGGFYMDDLVGWHLYKKGNTVVESSWQFIDNVSGRTFLGGNYNPPNGTVCEGTLKDITKGKDGTLFLTLNAAQNQLIWRLTEPEGMRVYGKNETAPQAGYTLPRWLTLTKL